MRLQAKVLTLFLIVFFLSGLLISHLSKRMVQSVLVGEIGKRGLLKIEDLPSASALGFQSGDSRILNPILRKGLDRTGGVYAIALNREGAVLSHTEAAEKGKIYRDSITQNAVNSDHPEYHQITLQGRQLLDISLPVWGVGQSGSGEESLLIGGKGPAQAERLGTLRIGLPLEEAIASESELSKQVVSIVSLIGGAAAALVLLSIRRILRRIRLLVEGTERISRGEYGALVPVGPKDELGFLASSFNRMSERLARRDELILSSAGEGIFGLDLDGKISFVNPAAARMLAYRVEELIGQPMHEFLHHSNSDGTHHPKEECPIDATFRDRTVHHVTTEVFWRKDGTSFPVEYVSTPLQEQGNVAGAVVVIKDITERQAQAAVLEYQATHDTLTDLPNRTLLSDHLNQALTRAFWHKRLVAVLFLDLDNFKQVNDTQGHDFGDLLLKDVAERLSSCLRGGDAVASLGGDEVVIVLADMTKGEDVRKVAQKLLQTLSRPMELIGKELFITTSIGISLYPNDGDNVETLLKNADTAMYRAKEKGKNHFELFSAAMNARILERLALETDLHRALEKKEFVLHYQPQIELQSGQIVGMEALLRLKRYGNELVYPKEFIPVAEETGLILPIGEWVLLSASTQNKVWQQMGFPPIRIAVNLSARQFQQKDVLEMVARALKESGLDPHHLELELTESILMQNEETTIKMLRQLNETGVGISIDDFGTGYSSLSYLKRFPITALKIAESFIQDIPSDLNNLAIVKSIITLGHSLNLKVVAEAVETIEQLEFLQSIQCDEIQGFLFSQPLSAEDATQILLEKKMLPLPNPSSNPGQSSRRPCSQDRIRLRKSRRKD